MKELYVPTEYDGCRLDKFLRKTLPTVSLPQIFKGIRKGNIKVNGKKSSQSYRISENDKIAIFLEIGEIENNNDKTKAVVSLYNTKFYKENFHILFEDEDIIVCNKPSGLVVHAGTSHTGHKTLIDLATSYLLNKNGDKFIQPTLLHRLDRDTSGLIVITKNKRILRELQKQIREHSVKKHYIAICHGAPQKRSGKIEVNLQKRYEKNNGTKMRVADKGEYSLSTYRLLEKNKEVSKLTIQIYTGKTHQIRVHASHMGFPLLGDIRYGNKEKDAFVFTNNKHIKNRLYLHAEELTFFYPPLNRSVTFQAPLPKEFKLIFP